MNSEKPAHNRLTLFLGTFCAVQNEFNQTLWLLRVRPVFKSYTINRKIPLFTMENTGYFNIVIIKNLCGILAYCHFFSTNCYQ